MSAVTSLDRRNHIFAVIAGTVLALGLVRAALLVFHSPMLGYVRPDRWLGVLGLAEIGAVAVVTALALRRHPVASIVHALLFFLIVADPVSMLWLTTAAAERHAIIATYAVTAMVAVIALGNATRVHWIVLMAALIVEMSMAPRSLMLLPLILVAVAAPVLLRRSRQEARWVLAAGVLASAALCFFQSAESPPNAATTGISLVPEAALARTAESPLAGLLRGAARATSAAMALAPAGLDVSPEGKVHRIADLPPYVMSFAGLATTMPAPASMFLAMIMVLLAPFAVAWLAWAARRSEPVMAAVPAAFAMLVVVAAYCTIAAALVPENADIARSQWLGALAMLGALALLPLVAWHLSVDFWAGRIAVVAAFGVVLMAAGWFAWARTQPVAIGTVERMYLGANHTLQVSGWAIDPRGVKRVFATVGGGPETSATLGTERRDLQAAYPGYPDVLTGGFQMSIESNAWRENQVLRVYAENRTGAITEIARRDVRLAP